MMDEFKWSIIFCINPAKSVCPLKLTLKSLYMHLEGAQIPQTGKSAKFDRLRKLLTETMRCYNFIILVSHLVPCTLSDNNGNL